MGSGEVAALLAAMIWAGTSVALTSLSARTNPVVLSGLRLGFGSIVVLAVLAFSGQAGSIGEAPTAGLLGVIISGFIGYGIGDTVYIVALKRVGMQRTFPVTMALFIALTVAGGVVLLGEDLSWGLPAGALLIGLGVYLLVIPARTTTIHAMPTVPAEPAMAALAETRQSPYYASPGIVGYALLVAVGVFWTIATLWLANAKGDLEPVAAAAVRTPAGAAALLGLSLATARPDLVAPFRDRNQAALIIAAGIIGTGIGSVLYVYSVLEAGAAQAAVLSACSPLMALPLSIVFLGERFTQRIALGTVICVAGIILVVVA